MPFLRFDDGDVEIRFTQDDRDSYVLHSYVLALHSSWFKASLSERWDQGEPRAAGQRHVYELRFEKDSVEGWLMRSTTGKETEMVSSTRPASSGAFQTLAPT